MRLPTDCSYRLTPPSCRLWGATATIATETAPDLPRCCRGQGWLIADEEPLCRTIGSDGEVYRFV